MYAQSRIVPEHAESRIHGDFRRAKSRWARVLLAPGVLMLLLSTTAWGGYIASDQLFQAPSDVPMIVYDGSFLINVPFSDSGGSVDFSISNVPGATELLGLSILPVLNPFPNDPEGVYTPADLAAINLTNYDGYYAFQPNTDYFASEIVNNASTVSFNGNADGAYFVNLHTSNGSTTSNTFIRVEFGDFLGKDPATDPTGPERKVTLPATDLTIISDGDPNDNGYLTNAQKQLPNAVKAKTVQETVDAIKKYYDDHGQKKFEVTLIGHGRAGSIKIGTQRINNDTDTNGGMTPAEFQKAIDKYASSVHFFSCNTGSGEKGKQFLKDIFASIPIATAYDGYTTASQTYFDAGATARAVRGSDVVPEPSNLFSVLLCAPVIMLFARRHRGKTADRTGEANPG